MADDWSQGFTPGVAPPSQAGPPRPGVVRLAYGPAPQQFADLRVPKGLSRPRPVALVVHGGAYRNRYHLDLMDGLCEDLAARGVATWNIEYRRVGDPGAEWPGMFQDVAAAADYLGRAAQDYPLDLSRVVALGHSAGGHLVLWLAARQHNSAWGVPAVRLGGVVALAPVVSLKETYADRPDTYHIMMGGPPTELADRYDGVSPLHLLPLGVPVRVVVGDQDALAPGCRRYVAQARTAGDDVALVELSGVEHFQPIVRGSPAWARTVETLLPLFA